MKVSVTVSLDIDPESWTMNYGVEGKAEIRADVKEYVKNSIHDHMHALGLLVGS